MGLGPGHIGHRGAIGINAHSAQFGGNHRGAGLHQPRRDFDRHGAGDGIKGRVPFAPMGRAQPLDAAALLIDQNWRLAAHGIAQRAGQAAQLVRVLDIAGKDDKAERISAAEKGALTVQKLRSGAAEDRCPAANAHRCGTGMQIAALATKAVQKRRASASSSNPWARRR